MKLIKKILICLVLGLCNSTLYATPVDSLKALKFAKAFFTQQGFIKNGNLTDLDFQLIQKVSYQNKNLAKNGQSSIDDYLYYIFNIGQGDGFIIIAGDDASYPVLGYSQKGSFDIKDEFVNIIGWLKNYETQIAFIKANNLTATSEINYAWNNFGAKKNSRITAVSPLIQTMWNQSSLYNNSCPIDNNGIRSITGCVATAMAQIMKYWNYPAQGKGVGSYWLGKTDNFCYSGNGTHTTNVVITGVYDWANMPNSLTSNSTSSEINAIAKLMYDCGISVDMSYSSSSSGACYDSRELVDHFNYDTGLRSESRSNYTDNNWKQLLYEELNNERPIWYSGHGEEVGHSWVCDGYDNSGNFHMNWGWGGYSNGYFLLDALNPANYSFNSWQSAVVGIKPTCNVLSPTTTGISRCGTGSVTLSATGCTGTYNWYAASSGGNSLGTASSYTTPSISTTTPYYVSCTVGNCTSTRASAVATINNVPSAPTIAPVSINSGQTATLTASNCNTGTVKWYDASTGGNLLFSGNPYMTSVLTNNTTFYATCTISSCESATRGSGTVTVNPVNNPCPPTITHNTSVLPAGTYQAGQTISSKADVSSPTIFKAGQSILLTHGFRAGPNETFLAKIEGCATAPTNGLVAYYPFNGNANDESGNGKHGTVNGTATYPTGIAGSAIRLNAFGIHIPQLITNSTTAFAISIWVKEESLTSNDGEGYIFFGDHSNSGWTGILHGDADRSVEKMYFAVNGSTNIAVNPPTNYKNNWVNYQMVYSSNTLKAFVNGVLVGQLNSANIQIGHNKSGIGTHWYGNGNAVTTRFIGSMDNIRIYNRALTDAEVLQIYNAEKP